MKVFKVTDCLCDECDDEIAVVAFRLAAVGQIALCHKHLRELLTKLTHFGEKEPRCSSPQQ